MIQITNDTFNVNVYPGDFEKIIMTQSGEKGAFTFTAYDIKTGEFHNLTVNRFTNWRKAGNPIVLTHDTEGEDIEEY